MKTLLCLFVVVTSACSDSLPAPSEYDSSLDTGAIDLGGLPIDGTTADATGDGTHPPLPDFGSKDSTVDKGFKSDSTVDQGKIIPDVTLDLPPVDSTPADSTVDATVDVGVCTAPPGGEWTADTQAMAVVGSSKIIYAIAGGGADNVYIAGYGGDIWRRTASGWSH